MGHALGAKGPLVLGVTWTEAALAIILVALRAKTASFTEGKMAGVFGLRWDCIWVIFAMVGFQAYAMTTRKYSHDQAIALAAQSLMTVSAVYGLGM